MTTPTILVQEPHASVEEYYLDELSPEQTWGSLSTEELQDIGDDISPRFRGFLIKELQDDQNPLWTYGLETKEVQDFYAAKEAYHASLTKEVQDKPDLSNPGCEFADENGTCATATEDIHEWCGVCIEDYVEQTRLRYHSGE